MPSDAATTEPTILPPIVPDKQTVGRLRRRGVANLSCMGHCAPAVMQTLLEASGVDAPWLVRASGGLPGGIGNSGNECGGITAPLMLLGLRHVRDPLYGGVPAVVYKGHDLLRRFQQRHGATLCRDIRGNDRVPLRCIGVVRHAGEEYGRTLTDGSPAVLPEQSRAAFARLHTHFTEHQFLCGHAALAPLRSTLRVNDALRDALSGFIGGTVFTGRTCGALTAAIVAVGAALGTIERSRLRVLHMIGLMAVGGDAFADDRNAFNRTMNLGHRLSEWFAQEFGSTQCRDITGCDFSTMQGVDRYISRGQLARCRQIAERAGMQAHDIIESGRSKADRGEGIV